MELRITQLLRPERIALGAPAMDRLTAIDALIALHGRNGVLLDPQRYRADVLLREAEGSTALGRGLAVPHGKSAGVLRPALAAMTLTTGVDWAAPDALPCRLLFLIAAPAGAADLHLQILSKLMQLLIRDELPARLMAAADTREFFAALAEQERLVFPIL